MNKFVNSLKNYLGDYAPLAINHKKYEVDVISQGADSGTALYDYCMQVIDQKFFGQAQIKILDLACGQGPFGVAAKKAGKSYIIDGIDIFVPEKDKLTEQCVYKQVIEADILKYDFGKLSDKYDLVVSNQFFEHLFPEESFNLLKKIIGSNTSLLISVPLPHQTFAYTKDYLLASLKEKEDFSDRLSLVVNAEVHKTYFPKKMMKLVGFSVLPNPVFRSNFFYWDKNFLKPKPVKLENFFNIPKDALVEKELIKMYSIYGIKRGNQSNRRQYEKNLIKAMLMEPKRYKIIRKIIYLVLRPVRFFIRLKKF